MRLPAPILPVFLLACAGGGSGDLRGGGCPRVAIPEEVVVEGGRFDASTPFTIQMTHECSRGGVLEITEFALSDLERFAFRDPPGRQLQPDSSRDVRLAFMPSAGNYSYEATFRVGYGEDRAVETRIIATADPDQDGDGVDAIEVGGSDCNDLDPRVQVASPERDDGLDNDCDGWVDEDFVTAGAVRITEVMSQPRSARAEFGQWVELHNQSERDVNVRGLRIEHDDGQLVVQTDTIVSGGERALLGLELDTFLNGGLDLDGLLLGELLPGRPTRVALVSDVTHSEALVEDWPGKYGVSGELDRRVALRDRETDTVSWCGSLSSMGGAARGTPRAENRTCPDVDFDGDGYTAADGDCDDARPESRPGGTEDWNGLDDNCDGLVDTMWVEDRLEDEVRGVPSPNIVAIGAPDGAGADRVLVHGGDELFLIDGAVSWGGDDVGTVAGASLRLPEIRTDLLYSRMIDLGTGSDVAVIGVGGASVSGPVRLLQLPTRRGQPEAERVVVDVTTAGALPGGFDHGDFDGDGVAELVFARDHVFILDLDGQSGSVDEVDVVESELRLPPRASQRRVETTDLNDDGYDDLQVGLVDGGALTLFIPGQARPPPEADAIMESEASFLYYGSMLVVDVDDDGSREILTPTSQGLRRFDGPLTGSVSTVPSRELIVPAQHRVLSLDLRRQDVDGDPFDEVVLTSDNSAGGRAWFVDQDGLSGSGEAELARTGASQWAPQNVSWTWVGAMDHDGDGRDSVLFWASDGRLQRIPPRL